MQKIILTNKFCPDFGQNIEVIIDCKIHNYFYNNNEVVCTECGIECYILVIEYDYEGFNFIIKRR